MTLRDTAWPAVNKMAVTVGFSQGMGSAAFTRPENGEGCHSKEKWMEWLGGHWFALCMFHLCTWWLFSGVFLGGKQKWSTAAEEGCDQMWRSHASSDAELAQVPNPAMIYATIPYEKFADNQLVEGGTMALEMEVKLQTRHVLHIPWFIAITKWPHKKGARNAALDILAGGIVLLLTRIKSQYI